MPLQRRYNVAPMPMQRRCNVASLQRLSNVSRYVAATSQQRLSLRRCNVAATFLVTSLQRPYGVSVTSLQRRCNDAAEPRRCRCNFASMPLQRRGNAAATSHGLRRKVERSFRRFDFDSQENSVCSETTRSFVALLTEPSYQSTSTQIVLICVCSTEYDDTNLAAEQSVDYGEYVSSFFCVLFHIPSCITSDSKFIHPIMHCIFVRHRLL